MARTQNEPVEPKAPPFSGANLVHPVYLDTPMLLSFVAALEDGAALSTEQTQVRIASDSRARSAGGKAGLPGLSAFLGLTAEVNGNLERTKGETDTTESKAIREHTAASLFNRLYTTLVFEGAVRTVASLDDLDLVCPGDIVCIQGEVLPNPVEKLVYLANELVPYAKMLPQVNALAQQFSDKQLPGVPAPGVQAPPRQGSARAKQPKQAGQPAQSDPMEPIVEAFAGVVSAIYAELASAPVRDVAFQIESDLLVVAALNSEYFTRATMETLTGGSFSVLGKATRVLGPQDTVNLARRGTLGMLDPTAMQRGLTGLTSKLPGIIPGTMTSLLAGPGLEVLPLAVFS